MNLEEKIEEASLAIREVAAANKKPIIACSFGKDSIVMLDLIRRCGFYFPILFYREPYFPKKCKFANRLIEDWNLVVYDYPASATSIGEVDGRMEIMNYYLLSDGKINRLPTGVYDPVGGEPYLCGYEDLYLKPTGGINFPWDVLFVGHKSSDVDFLLGPIPLIQTVYKADGGPTISFPIRNFTDEDIWEYTEQFSIPYNEKRYDKDNGYAEFSDRTYNNDWYPTCTACLKSDAEANVYCPRRQEMIEAKGNSVRRYTVDRMEYMG